MTWNLIKHRNKKEHICVEPDIKLHILPKTGTPCNEWKQPTLKLLFFRTLQLFKRIINLATNLNGLNGQSFDFNGAKSERNIFLSDLLFEKKKDYHNFMQFSWLR